MSEGHEVVITSSTGTCVRGIYSSTRKFAIATLAAEELLCTLQNRAHLPIGFP